MIWIYTFIRENGELDRYSTANISSQVMSFSRRYCFCELRSKIQGKGKYNFKNVYPLYIGVSLFCECQAWIMSY